MRTDVHTEPGVGSKAPRRGGGGLFRDSAEVLLLAIVYIGLGKLSLMLAFAPDSAAPVWPGTGLAIAALLRRGYRLWPGVAVGTWVLMATSAPGPLAGLGIAAGNTLEAVAAVFLIRRVVGTDFTLGRVRDTVGYIVLAGLVSTWMSVVLGVVSLRYVAGVLGPETMWPTALVWWAGNLVGCIVIGPLLLSIGEPAAPRRSARTTVEYSVLMLLVFLIAELVFGFLRVGGSTRYPLTFLLFPPLVWGALRFGHLGASGVSFIISLLAVVATASEIGPFVRPTGTTAESVALLAALMTTLSSSGLVLSAVMNEREQAARSKLEVEARYHLVVEHASDGIFISDRHGKYLEANPRGLDMLGYSLEELRELTVNDLLVLDAGDTRPAQASELQTGKYLLTERRLRHKDGSHVPVEVSAKKLPDGRILGIVRDIRERRRAEESAREYAERFAIVAKATNDAVWDWNLRDGAHWWNDGFSTLFGYPAAESEAGNNSWTSRIHPDDLGRVSGGLQTALSGAGEAWTDEYRFRRADGTYADIFDRGFIKRDAAGTPVRMIGAMQDISERKRLLALSEGERAILELLARGESLPELLRRLVLRKEGMFPGMKCSILLLDATGRRLRHGAAPSLPIEFSQAVDGLEIGPGVGACGNTAHTGNTTITEDISTHPYWNSAKHLALSHGLRSCYSIPIMSSRQRVLGTLAVYYSVPHSPTDVEVQALQRGAYLASLAIERTQAEEALQASEQYLRTIFETEPESVLLLSPAGELLTINRTGVSMFEASDASELLGRLLVELVVPEHRPLVAELHDQVMNGASGTQEFQILGLRGTRRWLEIHAAPMRSATGQVTQLLGIARDVTAHKKAESQQQLMMRELDHRVKNNLAVVLSIADQTAHRVSTLAEFSERFNGRIMALARVHGLLAQSHWRGADLRTLVMRTLQPYADADNIRIRADGPVCHIPARCTGPLCMTFYELATNAAKYGALSNTQGTVDVVWRVEPDDDHATNVCITWEERGGPPVTEPTSRGFGTNLIEFGMEHEVGAKMTLEFRPTGLWCEMMLSLLLDGRDLELG